VGGLGGEMFHSNLVFTRVRERIWEKRLRGEEGQNLFLRGRVGSLRGRIVLGMGGDKE